MVNPFLDAFQVKLAAAIAVLDRELCRDRNSADAFRDCEKKILEAFEVTLQALLHTKSGTQLQQEAAWRELGPAFAEAVRGFMLPFMVHERLATMKERLKPFFGQ
jgi:hypothetical protein